ncbi:MAG: ABC transporter ATP-binding protein [Kiritimatiellaeota bacterium]|nr:ABC transporter ATP-binding protein [Kiritimatiellota bacterium]
MSEYAIQVEGLTKHYGKIKAVTDLDLNVRTGVVHGFLGPNGAGKTTVIKSLLGLVTPNAGSVSIFGRDLFSNRSEIMKKVGAVVEAPVLFEDFTAYENLFYLSRFSDIHGDRISKSLIAETLETVGLSDVADRKVRTFSYGMKQRLGIAQALLPENELIFLDEPTNGLDPHGIVGVRRLIKRISSELNVTVFLSSHLLSEVEQVCDYVTIIDYGLKIRESKTSDLMAERNLIELVTTTSSTFEKFAGEREIKVSSSDELEDGRWRFIVEGVESDIPGLASELVAEKIAILRIGKHQNTLEEIFVELTGKNPGNTAADRF